MHILSYHLVQQEGVFTMDISQDYIIDSLEQHLFFARIMKEHAFFLKVGFLPPNADLAKKVNIS